MHCLVVTIFYCVDNHFTSFVAILLLLTMIYNEFYYIICAIHGKNSLLCTYIGSAIGIGFFLNNDIGYRKIEKFYIGSYTSNMYQHYYKVHDVIMFVNSNNSRHVINYLTCSSAAVLVT